MGKVIIGIHGLGNKPPKPVLENWWKASINEGLQKIGKADTEYKFELIFWADILHKNLLDENITDPDSPLFLTERYAPAAKEFIPENNHKRRKVLDFLSKELDSIFLNKDLTLNYSFITDAILKRWFSDLDIYYKENCKDSEICKVKDRIRKKTVEAITKFRGEEILLIAHSMGSIISYDVLTFDKEIVPIDTFITIGSPLGTPVVKSKIAAERKLKLSDNKRLSTPLSIKRHWYNFSDLEDKVAYNYQLADDYSFNKYLVKPNDYIVNNDYESNGIRNPHKSYGYLRTPEVATKIARFLERRNPNNFERWVKNILKIFK
ncbi:MAG: hypothetical protein CR996_00415 [Draconibacterium sp.]|nr:MAG: hypothetical protein CR996_00415 [Draconibacterium sp.]PIF06491.1 MAG: hypothetical protein CSA36_01590 [Draconibacterium sp.]